MGRRELLATKQAAGPVFCGFAVSGEDLAIDNGGFIALSSLVKTRSSRRKVVDYTRHQGSHRVAIEYRDVGGVPWREHSAIVEAPRLGRLVGNHADGLLEREGLTLAYPVGKKMRLYG